MNDNTVNKNLGVGYLVRLVNEVKSERSDFEIFTGTEQLYVPLLLTGGDGGVMALANMALDIFSRAKTAFENGHLKELALGFMGIHINRYVRRPLQEDPFNEEEFKKILEGVGLI